MRPVRRAALSVLAQWAAISGRIARAEAALSARVPCLLAVSWHWTPPEERDAFARQVDFLSERFHVLDRVGLEGFRAGSPPKDRPALVLTFDDGNKNAREVAAPVLESRGLRGWFFVIAGAADRTLPAEVGGAWRSLLMGPEEWRDLAARGHVVGSHSWSHVEVGRLDGERLRREVVDSRAAIEASARTKVDSFAYPLGGDRSYSVESERLVRATYRHVFHSCPGSVRPDETRYGIGRYVLAPDLPISVVRWLVSGARDGRYAKRMARYRAICDRQMVPGTI